eukprot:TRINITY_DN45596_c0_g2_i1.p1 TRINITY_DN45596_c0_g2~~TRINITY_DN45596_c0_g2_i1.p1  ORF type:complete len:431 (-),score=96.56 TRINITY_DN45596_c0_g2_i1:264-1487(-)
MSDLALERYLDPLVRPPLSVSVLAASLKYAATVLILGEPLLFTRSDYIRRREDASSSACFRRQAQLLAQVCYVLLSANGMANDFYDLHHGFHHLGSIERVHFAVALLAFSPNTMAALAGLFIPIVKQSWNISLPVYSSRIARISDVVVSVFAAITGLVYLLPLALIAFPYLVLGFFSIGWTVCVDTLQLPMRLYHQDFEEMWIGLPVACAWILSHALVAALIAIQAKLFEMRYPEVLLRTDESEKAKAKGAMTMHKVPQHIIGVARQLVPSELTSGKAFGKAVDMEMMENGNADLLEDSKQEEAELEDLQEAGSAAVLATSSSSSSRREKTFVTDEFLACMMYFKVSACVFMPLLQLAVVVAAKVFLGASLRHAATSSFQERQWSHYLQHVAHAGVRRAPTLCWYFL